MKPRALLYVLFLLAWGPFAVAQGTCPASVTDVDGNAYPVVQIGDRCWIAKNLATAHYANGDSIPTGLSDNDWEFTGTGACTVYAFDTANGTTFGKLYNWFAVTDGRNLCPSGWHASTDADWMAMELHLGMDPTELSLWNWRGALANVGGQLKSTSGWAPPNNGATNSSGFSALPGGYAGYDQTFEFLNVWGQFWTSSDNAGAGIGRRLTNGDVGIDRSYYINQVGFSCRCVYDQLVAIRENGTDPPITLWQDPATEELHITWNHDPAGYQLFDGLGRTVRQGRLRRGLNTLDISMLGCGVYLLLVDGAPQGTRWVKE